MITKITRTVIIAALATVATIASITPAFATPVPQHPNRAVTITQATTCSGDPRDLPCTVGHDSSIDTCALGTTGYTVVYQLAHVLHIQDENKPINVIEVRACVLPSETAQLGHNVKDALDTWLASLTSDVFTPDDINAELDTLIRQTPIGLVRNTRSLPVNSYWNYPSSLFTYLTLPVR